MNFNARLRSSLLAILLLVAWTGAVFGKDPELVATLKHDGPVICLAFSPDGRHLFCGVMDGAAMMWDVANRGQVAKIKPDRGSIFDVKMTADGRHAVFFVNFDTKISFWDIKTKRSTREVAPPIQYMGPGLAISRDGRLMAIAAARDVALIDPATGKIKSKLTGHTETVQDLLFSADGRQVISSASDGVRIWDVATQKALHSIPVKLRVDGIDLSPDGKSLAIAGYGAVITADVATGKVLHNVRRHNFNLGGVAFSPDGKTIASCDVGGTIKLWTAADLKETHTLSGAAKDKGFFALGFSPDGSLLAVGSNDHTVRLWQVAEPKQVASAEQPAETDEPAETEQPVRTWTAAGGKYKVKARLVKFDGVNVHLELESGKTIKVPLKKLDEGDQRYLRDRAK